MIDVFASEYVVASFEDVQRVLESFPAASTSLRITGGLRRRSGTVASVPIEWCDTSSPPRWHVAELRVIRVQSGNAPLTEILLVMPSQANGADARAFLAGLGRQVEESLGLVRGRVAGLPRPA